ncbi:MAG: M56 family metallopeptidase [Candidatus Methylomirabilales bacterium]
MTVLPRNSRSSRWHLGLLVLLGLIPAVGMGVSLAAPVMGEFSRTVGNACLAMMGFTPEITQQPLTLPPMTAGALLVIAGSFLWATFRLVASLLATRRLRERSQAYSPGRYPKLDRALARQGLSLLSLRVFETPRPMALTLGLVRPQVLLSEGMISTLSEEELGAVLCHEVGHVRHRDPFRLALVRFLADAVWFLPVARPLAGNFADAVEEKADDWAVASTRQPVELASALVKTAKAAVGQPIPAATSLAGNLSVEDRVERLLGEERRCRSGTTTLRWVASGAMSLGLLVLLVLPVAGPEARGVRPTELAGSRMPMMACAVSMR